MYYQHYMKEMDHEQVLREDWSIYWTAYYKDDYFSIEILQ
jgi:hypothetical protein